MVKKSELEAHWEGFIKMLLTRLDIPTKKDISLLHRRLDRIEKLVDQKKSGTAKKARPGFRKKSASSIVLEVFANHPEGTDFKTVKSATGFEDKKLRNIIYRLDKIKRIKRVKRGIYKKA